MISFILVLFFFFFSSRRRHTRSLCDWSSDVCSSDLRCESLLPAVADETVRTQFELAVRLNRGLAASSTAGYAAPAAVEDRSGERRVGKECRARWVADERKKKRTRRYVDDSGRGRVEA